MPYVKVQIIAGRTPEQKQGLGKAITDAVSEHLGTPPASTYVVIEDVEAENWLVGGVTVAERRKAAEKG
jgi:4-oxalocrotonate tautomerase